MQQRRVPLGRASAFIEASRATTLGGNTAAPVSAPNFVRITVEEYRELLTQQGASAHMIEQELTALRRYKARIDVENAERIRDKRKRERDTVARGDLGEYFDAAKRMVGRVKGKKEKDDGT